MSDTPRTDNAALHGDGTTVPADFAADLERELATARAIADRCGKDNCMGWDVEGCNRWVSEVRFNKLHAEVERLREVAGKALTDEEIHYIARHQCFLDFDDEGKAVELFARAIERAHKIGGNDE
jgi:hypothetical protein